MDLSTNSIGWHRTRQWLDTEITAIDNAQPFDDNHAMFLSGQQVAYMKVRARFNTPEESEQAEKTRREMFG